MPLRLFTCCLALLFSLTGLSAPSTLVLERNKDPVGKHVVLLSGDEEYRSEEALPMLAKILSQRHGFKCTVLFALDPDGTINPDNSKSLAGAEALDTADLIIMSLRFRAWPDEQMKHFVDAYRRGVPIVALRTSTHAFKISSGAYQDYTNFGKNVLGEQWVSHWGKHKFEATRGVIEPGAAAHPLLTGVTNVFGTTDVYEANPPADATILLRGLVLKGMNPLDPPADHRKTRKGDQKEQGVNSPAMAIAWTRLFRNDAGKENRIFTTTMGAATDLENESLRRLVVNAVYWGLDMDIPTQADVRFVDPYAPRMYGMKGYRVQLTPADYALDKTVPEGAVPPQRAKAPSPKGAQSAAPVTLPLSLNPGEHIAIIGNTLADRLQLHGSLETLIHARYPQHGLVIRNLAAAGDEVVVRARSKDFGSPDEWLAKVEANTVFAFFGFNESFAGPEGLPEFEADLNNFIQTTKAKNYSGVGAPRIVLFSPIANERHPDLNFPDPAANNRNLELYTAAMQRVALENGVSFVNLFAPSQKLFADAAQKGQALTINGLHLSEMGDAQLAPVIFQTLFGEPAPKGNFDALRAAVNAKSEMWRSRYRTVDGYNVYGGRSTIAYDSLKDQTKITNFQVMQEEMSQRDVMTANLDRRLWSVARGGKGVADELPLPPVTPMGTNKPGSKPDGTYEFVSGEEGIKKMTTSPGVKVNLFASEEQFPQLAKPVQMNWDTKGRLWVAVWPNYPLRTPTTKQGDSILIFEDTDQDGRADKVTTFLSDLNAPTGFQFFKDGILVVQAPDVWFVRDTDGDGKADWKERILMGLDSADTHHTSNSLAVEPGGAILFSDGVFHRTQVESAAGPVRNIDGGIFRFEPLTGRFETYVAFGFANPHGRTFDYWGNDFITDATGNHTYFGPAFSGRIDYPSKHPKMKTIWERPSRPSAGSTVMTSTHFPEEFWGSFLNPNVIGFQGIYRVKLMDDGSGIKGERQPDLLSSSDKNFRPIDLSIGPDGAIYVIDWHNPLIGHLQSHLRDSNRDHTHGRIYRVTYEGRPLAQPPRIDGQPVKALVELLKRPETQIRNLAKIELGKHPSSAVMAAVKTWTAALDPKDPDFQHHLTEALWMHQWHNQVNLELLARVLRSPNPYARAAATRVISYWRDRVPNALALLQRQAGDEHPRVRLQAVRAASFFPVIQATEVALAATKHPIDYYLDYTLGETLRQLRPQWRKSLGEGTPLAGGDPASIRYLLRSLTVAELLKMPRTPEVEENIVGRSGISDAVRIEALENLAKRRNVKPVALLVATIDSPAEVDVKNVGRLLLSQSAEDLRSQRAALTKLAMADTSEGRTYAWAALAMADGSLDRVWEEASKSPLSQASLLGGIPLIPDLKLRAQAYDRVMAILATSLPNIQGPDYIVNVIQREAIRSAVSTRREPAKVFAALVAIILRGEQVPTAAQGLRALPRNSWPQESAVTAAQALLTWAGKTHSSERTSRDYIETIQAAEELAGVLPPAEATAARSQLASLRVAVFIIRSVREEMRYDTPRLVVPAGKPFDIIFENVDVMPHNLVVVKPTTREQVGLAAMSMLPDNRDLQGRTYIPASTNVIAATKMLESGQNESLKIAALRVEGIYEYVCTFPGHWAVMYGQLVVTKDVDAYLKANPVAAAPTAKPAPAAHAHGTTH